MNVIMSAIGGLALFLLAMSMMTDGLKVSAGSALRTLLEKWTSNPGRGILSGILVTSLVQSSSAVTVTTIGFVNAGVMSLRQALAVVFGANIGTTITGWLVSVTGLGFKIEALALPLIALGVGLKFLASTKRLQGAGEAVIGFGLFFLGLAILKESFSGFAGIIGADSFSEGPKGMIIALAVGIMVTVLTQSSSAAMALILTAAGTGTIGIPIAAIAIIGANIGTTSTALFATIGATPNAKRVAAGHISFNLVTGIAALALLPIFLLAINFFSSQISQSDTTVVTLALFHTAFNIFGVLLFLPFITKFSNYLEKRFRSDDDDFSRPLHIDSNIKSTPSLAIPAMQAELKRVFMALTLLGKELTGTSPMRPSKVKRRLDNIMQLELLIDDFGTKVRMEQMSKQDSERLPIMLQIGRYMKESSELVGEIQHLTSSSNQQEHDVKKALQRFHQQMVVMLTAYEISDLTTDKMDSYFDDLDAAYIAAKKAILSSGASRKLSMERTGFLLDQISDSRRAMKQLGKAGRLLSEGVSNVAIEPELNAVS